MHAQPSLSAVGVAVGDPTRAAILGCLLSGQSLPATDLAARAGVRPQTASWHLQRLLDARLVVAERYGRHRYFRLAAPEVAHALEAIAAVAPTRPVRSLRESDATAQLRLARTCYDHLAGRLGVALAQALVARDVLAPATDGGEFRLTSSGADRLATLGVDVAGAHAARRRFAPACLDWSERRTHVAGALGAVLCDHIRGAGWIEPRPGERSVRILPGGRTALRDAFGIDLDDSAPRP